MRDEEGIDDRVDYGALVRRVADSEAQVEHERQIAPLGEASGVFHGALDAAGHRDPAAGAVRDLQAEQVGARRDAVEAGDLEETVSRRDPRHVRAVRAVVEHEVERRCAVRFLEIRGQRDRLRSESDRLAPFPVIVQRRLVFEGAVQVRIHERHPPIGRLHHDHGEPVGVVTVAV